MTCTTISTLMNFFSYKWHKDLQQFSQKNELISVMRCIYHTLTCSIIFFFYSTMHNFLYAKRLHKVIWHKTHIYFTYITIHSIRHKSAPYMYKISLVHRQITYSDNMAIFHTSDCYQVDKMLSDMCICTIIKMHSNYKTPNSVQNHTPYIHHDILTCSTPCLLQQQITHPTKYKSYTIHNCYVLKLSIKSPCRYTNDNILIYDICS